MLEDEGESNRVKDAKHREDADLEQQIREGDKDPMRVKANPPIEISGGVEMSKAQEAQNTCFSKLTEQNDPALSAIKAGSSRDIVRPEPCNSDGAPKEINFTRL